MGTSGAGAPHVANIDDVSVTDVWELLKSDSGAVLVDVRTRAEWNFVGIPELNEIGKKPIFIEWQSFPESRVDSQFAQRLHGLLSEAGVSKDSEIFFICRSGGRSKSAAQVMAAEGYLRCHNVADGFEGPLDPDRHRGRLGGWKSAGLPWAQG